MAARQIVLDSLSLLRRQSISRFMNHSRPNVQDGFISLLFHPNHTDRVLRPVWELNQSLGADSDAVVQDRFVWMQPTLSAAQARESGRGRLIPKEIDTEDSGEDDEFEDIEDFDDDEEDDDDDEDDDDEEEEEEEENQLGLGRLNSGFMLVSYVALCNFYFWAFNRLGKDRV